MGCILEGFLGGQGEAVAVESTSKDGLAFAGEEM